MLADLHQGGIAMTHRFTTVLLVGLWLTLAPPLVQAQTSIVQHRDGTSSTITHLGEDVGIRSDAHGNGGPVTGLGIPSSPGTIPHGDTKSGTITTFGTPAPPNNLTPAPVLPFNPNRPLMPQPSSPASPSGSSPGFGAPGGGGRFGR